MSARALLRGSMASAYMCQGAATPVQRWQCIPLLGDRGDERARASLRKGSLAELNEAPDCVASGPALHLLAGLTHTHTHTPSAKKRQPSIQHLLRQRGPRLQVLLVDLDVQLPVVLHHHAEDVLDYTDLSDQLVDFRVVEQL